MGVNAACSFGCACGRTSACVNCDWSLVGQEGFLVDKILIVFCPAEK